MTKRTPKSTGVEIVEREPVSMPIVEEITKNFVLYAKEINKNRAFPHLLPGIKPIHGHALWAMWANGRKHNRPFTKSAKIAGEVMSYSPHAECYGSLVLLCQDFTYHIPYITGRGSFGSLTGGPTPAASRYTEMKLSEFIEDVLFYNTKLLDMGMNYLEEEPEPILNTWVALLPLLFMTNTSGMGYTVSNSWSSGNLLEFREQLLNYLKTGKVDCSKIYPDFPNGGIIINKSEMKELYETGKGTIKLRGKTEIEGDTIKIYSLPYQKYPEQFMEDVKKLVTTSQTTITDVADRCDDEGFLIEIECEAGTAEYVREVLFRKTCLQVNISDEHKAVTAAGKPELITFPDYMKTFVDANIALVIKEAVLNLEEINERKELVDGLLNALEIIDEIIKTIKKSKSMDDAKTAIMKMPKYKFTEKQADYIVHTPLGRLANLEQVKLQDEKKDLDKRKAEMEDLRDNPKSQKKYFLNRFNKLVDKYGWERKTEVIDVEMPDLRVAVDKPAKLARPKKEFMVVLTDTGALKRIEVTKFRATGEDNKNIKVQGNQKVTLVTNKGNMYKVMSNQINLCMPAAAGTPIKDIRPEISDDEKVLAIYDEAVTMPYIYFVTKNGLGKCGKVKDVVGLSKKVGAVVCGLKSDDDEIIAIKLLDDKNKVEIITDKRKEVIVPGKAQGRSSSGKKVINLKKGEEIIEVHSV